MRHVAFRGVARRGAVRKLVAMRFPRASWALLVPLAWPCAALATEPEAPNVAAPATVADAPTAPIEELRFSVADLDRMANPRQDFVKFAAGGWLATAQIPDDQFRWTSFNALERANWAKIHLVLEAAAADTAAPPVRSPLSPERQRSEPPARWREPHTATREEPTTTTTLE